MAMLQKLRSHKAVVQVFLELVTIFLAACIFMPLGKITSAFDGNCLLNSNVFAKKTTDDTYTIDLKKTTFERGNLCDYTTYINAAVAIHSTVWMWFFVHMKSLRAANGSISNVLLPALVLRLIFVIILIVSSIQISSGFSRWCDNITNNLSKLDKVSCSELQDLTWKPSRSKFYTYSVMATVCSWLLVAVLAVSCGITIFHLYDDFLLTMEPALKKLAEEESAEDDFTDGQGVDNEGTDGIYELDNSHGDHETELELASEDSGRVRNKSKLDH